MRIESIVDEHLAAKLNSITSSTYEWHDIQLKKFVALCHEHNITELSQTTAALVNQFVADCQLTTPTQNMNEPKSQNNCSTGVIRKKSLAFQRRW